MNSAEKEETTPEEPETVSVNDLELEQLRREAKDFKEKYFLLLAESENARKRMQKEKHELTQYAFENLIIDFLNPIDQMENALSHADEMSDEVKHWALGFKMILSQFKDVLTNNGVEPFTSEGKPFDPHHHEAMEAVETEEHTPGTIIEEQIRGYRMGEKTIRPARVKVAKEVKKENNEEEEN